MTKKVTIEVLSNVRCRMTGAPKAVLKYLDEQLAETQKGSEWAPTHRRFGGRWDGKKHHFHISPTFEGVGTFPKGLTHRVHALLAKQKVKARTKDLRTNMLPGANLALVKADMLEGVSMSGKYSYQLEAVRKALEAQSGILFMATNAGKSEIATAMIKVLSSHSILFVVPNKNLLKQTRETIAERLGTIPENIGVIGGGKFMPKEITVAIINSITPAKAAKSARARHKNDVLRAYLKSIDVVFLDEGHHAKAATWFRLMSALVNAQYRYLMSGTPFGGGNDLMVEAATGPVIYEIRNDALIKLGVSAKPTVRLIEIAKPDLTDILDEPSEDDPPKSGLDDWEYPEEGERQATASWNTVYEAGIVDNVYRNGIIAREASAYAKQGKSVIVLVRRLKQGANIRAAIAKLKTPVEFAHGAMPEPTKDKHVAWFKGKPGRVLIGSTIFDEGMNMPNINVLIVADGGQSLRKTLQQVGRAVRSKKTGENVVDIIDFADQTHTWLAKHALERYDIYKGEDFDVIEGNPETQQQKREEADESRRAEQDGQAAVQALRREADGRDELHGHVESQLRTARITTQSCAVAVPESGDVMLWHWRQTA